jgi:hypothetical protein
MLGGAQAFSAPPDAAAGLHKLARRIVERELLAQEAVLGRIRESGQTARPEADKNYVEAARQLEALRQKDARSRHLD